MIKLRTNVSKAFWCRPKLDRPHYGFEEARWTIPGDEERSGPICWLDHLFEGGILLPGDLERRNPSDAPSRALTMLITGPPGSGKSVLAMELCYRWTLSRQIPEREDGLFCFHISTENSAERIMEKVLSFGWEHARIRFERYKYGAVAVPVVTVLGVDDLERRRYVRSPHNFAIPIDKVQNPIAPADKAQFHLVHSQG